jgi:phosphoserine/homoserine phosphotransferase
MIFAIDLEGVLAPEIWPILGAHFELPELRLTTRDFADFDELMRRRVAALRARRITLSELQSVAHGVHPFLGAGEFLARLRALGPVLIIADTFHELAEPLVRELGGHTLFANHFDRDAEGIVSRVRPRMADQRERIVAGLRSAGFAVTAMGDSLNDLALLRGSDHCVLYRPVEALRAAFPDAPVAGNLDEALLHMEWAARAESAPIGG